MANEDHEGQDRGAGPRQRLAEQMMCNFIAA
jgi:hypothetical protein